MGDIELVREALGFVPMEAVRLETGKPLAPDAVSALARIERALVSADSSLTWCVARHHADSSTKEAARVVSAITRKPVR